MKRPVISLSRALLLAAALGAAPAAAQQVDLNFPIEQFTLDNGLRVVVQTDHSAPTVAIAVYYDVGSRNEVEGRTGFAHLFEHMMFQGSANIPKGGHFEYISINGGDMNGTTSEDRTNYYEILPSDRLALGLWLEADRMRSLDISVENFENQRQVVKEERRLRVDNAPYMPGFLEFFDQAYDSFEYSHSVIGSMDDLDAAQVEDVQAFFELYYAPNNAVLTIVGDVEVDDARELVEAHFGDIPRGAQPPPVEIVEPGRTAMVEADLTDAIATQPFVMIGWQVPQAPSVENDAMAIADIVIATGESSRLYSRLVREDQSALDVSCFIDGRRGPDLQVVYATTAGADPTVVQAAIMEEIAELAANGITEAEFEAAQRQLVRMTVAGVEENLGRALAIGRDALYYNDPERINTAIDRIHAVTIEQVNDALRTYLVPERATVVRIRPATAETEPAPAEAGEVTE